MPNLVYISTGSNQNQPLVNLEMAAKYIKNICGIIVSISKTYKSKSWGYDGADFYNQALIVKTDLGLMQVFLVLKKIEKDLGKQEKTTSNYEDRPIDIDILFFNSDIVEKEFLQIPHPRLQDRNFVLDPLIEIAPDYIHPILLKSITELKSVCKDSNPTELVS